MYLSRVELNLNYRETMKALTNLQMIHGAVERSFIGKRRRNLWRIDWLGEQCYLLVLSNEQPDFRLLVEQFGYPNHSRLWETKDYSLLLTRLQEEQTYKFRLRANPVRSSYKDKNKRSGRGKVFAHVTQRQQHQWLFQRAEKYGFSLNEDEFDVIHSAWEKFHKGKNNNIISLHTATYEGILKIKNLEAFKGALTSGIGRAKAYGCGLLTLTR